MEKEKIIEIINDVENKSNKDLFITVNELYEEFEKTKQLIVDLTRHMESISELYNNVNTEIGKRQST
jgi:Na+/phosphate symporter